jgi:uncharacterized protein YcfL
MKKLLTLISIFLIVSSCSKDDDLLIPAELDNPIVMLVFCQSSIDDTLKIVEYEYDNDNLIKQTTIQNRKVESETTYEYNSENQIISKIYLSIWQKNEMTYIYNEDKQLINILYKFTGYDTDGKITNIIEYEAPREYDNNKLVKEWEHWGGYNTYEYIGDKIIKKTDYTKNGEELHITTYKYSGNLLIEEKRETSVGSLMYLKTYKYDSQNRLIQIKDGKNIIEKNYYFNKKLIEKRTYYFGIDPGYDICYGNYIIRYKY